jgi:uncharacterized protein involved in exopolysaccharide biosynthesis
VPELDRHSSTPLHAPEPPDVRRPSESARFEDELDLGRHFRVFSRHPLLLLTGALIGAIAGFIFATSRPQRYEAVTTLIAQLPTRQAPGGSDRASLRAFIENQTLVAQVIEELGLNQPPHKLSPQRFVAEALRVEEPAGTNLLRVRVQLGDPQQAADASRHLSEKAVALNKQVASEAGGVVRNELKPHLDEATQRLQTASEELVAYQREAQIELLQAESEALVGQRGELFKLITEIEGEKARLAVAEQELRRRQPRAAAGRSPETEEALRRAAATRDARDEPLRREPEPALPVKEPFRRTPDALRRDSTASAVPGRAPQAGAGILDRSKVTTDSGRMPSPELGIDRTAVDPETLDLSDPTIDPVYATMDLQVATSRARLAALERHREALSRRVGGSELKELTQLYQRKLELERRQNAYNVAQRLFEDVSTRFERARADSMGSSAYLQVIDNAARPDRPMPRKRTQTVAVGVLLGLLAGAIAALGLETRAAGTTRQ